MLIVASPALALSALIGGLSTGVVAYIGSALVLGVYFAMYSGTMEAVVYDTVLEETGGSDDFERRIGRVRLVESVSLVVSSLIGGWVAGVAGARVTYFLTVPFVLLVRSSRTCGSGNRCCTGFPSRTSLRRAIAPHGPHPHPATAVCCRSSPWPR